MRNVPACLLLGRLVGEVAAVPEIVDLEYQLRIVRIQKRSDVVLRPYVEFAFFAFAVGILGRIETAIGRGHVPHHISENLTRGHFVFGFMRRLECLRVCHRQHGLVVEHLLEMRQQPLLIGRVAMESETDMVVHPAHAHSGQRLLGHRQRLRIAGAFPEAQ